MKTLASRLETEYPGFNKDLEIAIEPIHDALAGDTRAPLLVLIGAVGFVLLIANANVANLLLARVGARQRELAACSAPAVKRPAYSNQAA